MQKNLRLIQAMADADFTGRTLHKATGVAESTISRLINCKSKPRCRTVGKFARAFGIEYGEAWGLFDV